MDSSNNHEFLDGQTITGRNLLYQAVYDILNEGLSNSNLDMQGDPISDQDSATKKYVDLQLGEGAGLKPLNEISSLYPTSNNVNMNNYKLTNLTQGTSTLDAINYGQLQTEQTTRQQQDQLLQDQITAQQQKSLADISQTINSTSAIYCQNQQIKHVSNATDNNDVLPLLQAQNLFAPIDVTLSWIQTNNPLSNIDLDMTQQRLKNIQDGVDNQDAISKNQLDTVQTDLQNQIDNIAIDSNNLIINSDIDLLNQYKVKNAVNGVDEQDYITKIQLDQVDNGLQIQIDQKANINDVYNKTETNTLLDQKASNELVNTKIDQDDMEAYTYSQLIIDQKDLALRTEISTATSGMMKYTGILETPVRFAGGLGNQYCASVPYTEAVAGQTYDRIYCLPEVDLDSTSSLEKSQPISGEQFNGWRSYYSTAITNLQSKDTQLETKDTDLQNQIDAIETQITGLATNKIQDSNASTKIEIPETEQIDITINSQPTAILQNNSTNGLRLKTKANLSIWDQQPIDMTSNNYSSLFFSNQNQTTHQTDPQITFLNNQSIYLGNTNDSTMPSLQMSAQNGVFYVNSQLVPDLNVLKIQSASGNDVNWLQIKAKETNQSGIAIYSDDHITEYNLSSGIQVLGNKPMAYNDNFTINEFTQDNMIVNKKYLIEQIQAYTSAPETDPLSLVTKNLQTTTLQDYVQQSDLDQYALQTSLDLVDNNLQLQIDTKVDQSTLNQYETIVNHDSDITNLQSQITNDVNNLSTNYYNKTESDTLLLAKATTTALNQEISTRASADTNLLNLINGKYSNTTTLNNITLANGNLSLNNYKITDLATPTHNQDAVTKLYVDSIASGTSSIPVGTIIVWYSSSIPNGWLLCDGTVFSSTTYPDLFAILGSNILPDFRGYFLRGCNTQATGLDPNRILKSTQTSQNLSHTHTGITDSNSHTHTYTRYNTLLNNVPQTGLNDGIWQGTSSQNSGSTAHTHTFTSDSSGGTEARPNNIAVNYIIRAVITGSSQVSGYNIPAIQNWDFSNIYKPINVINPTNQQDCVTLNYLQNNYTNTTNLVSNYVQTTTLSNYYNKTESDAKYLSTSSTLNSLALPTANVSMNNFNFTSLSDPTSNQQAVTLNYLSNTYKPKILYNSDLTQQLFYNSKSLRLKDTSQTNYLFNYNANTFLMEQQPDNWDYINNSTANYLSRFSKTGNHLNKPLYLADSSTNLNANTFGQNSQLYLGNNSSTTYSLKVDSTTQDIVLNCKSITIQPQSSQLMTLGSCNQFIINALTTDLNTGMMRIYGQDTNGHGLFVQHYIEASGYDYYVPVSHKQFKKNIVDIEDDLDNINFQRFYFDKEAIMIQNEELSNKISEQEQFGIVIENNVIPDRYIKQSQIGDLYSTVDLSKLKDDMLQWCIKKIKTQQQTIQSLEERLTSIEQKLIQLGL